MLSDEDSPRRWAPPACHAKLKGSECSLEKWALTAFWLCIRALTSARKPEVADRAHLSPADPTVRPFSILALSNAVVVGISVQRLANPGPLIRDIVVMVTGADASAGVNLNGKVSADTVNWQCGDRLQTSKCNVYRRCRLSFLGHEMAKNNKPQSFYVRLNAVTVFAIFCQIGI